MTQSGEIGTGLSFVMRDPFGTKIVVYEPAALSSKEVTQQVTTLGLPPMRQSGYTADELDQTLVVLKKFGLLRRSGKKYIKLLSKAKA